VVRLGATCKQLFMLTKEEAIWRSLVKQTFGEAALKYQRIAAERAEEKAGVEASGSEASEEVRAREYDGLVELVHKFDDLFKRLPSVSTARSWKDVFMTEDFWRKEVASEFNHQTTYGNNVDLWNVDSWEEIFKAETHWKKKVFSEFGIKSKDNYPKRLEIETWRDVYNFEAEWRWACENI
jgi:hypothetical protein